MINLAADGVKKIQEEKFSFINEEAEKRWLKQKKIKTGKCSLCGCRTDQHTHAPYSYEQEEVKT